MEMTDLLMCQIFIDMKKDMPVIMEKEINQRNLKFYLQEMTILLYQQWTNYNQPKKFGETDDYLHGHMHSRTGSQMRRLMHTQATRQSAEK